MPTGYTNGIIEGKITSFQQFAKVCMRAFGATIHMKEESLDKGYIPRVPESYYSKNINDLKAQLKSLKGKDDETIIAEYKAEQKEGIALYLGYKKAALENITKITKMLSEVSSWKPPTEQHENFKKFMIEQLNTTIEHDCDVTFYDTCIVNMSKELAMVSDAALIRKLKMESIIESMGYYKKQLSEDIKRCEDSNKWVSQLLESI